MKSIAIYTSKSFKLDTCCNDKMVLKISVVFEPLNSEVIYRRGPFFTEIDEPVSNKIAKGSTSQILSANIVNYHNHEFSIETLRDQMTSFLSKVFVLCS